MRAGHRSREAGGRWGLKIHRSREVRNDRSILLLTAGCDLPACLSDFGDVLLPCPAPYTLIHVNAIRIPRSLRTVRSAGIPLLVREVLRTVPVAASHPPLHGWPSLLRTLPHRLRLQDRSARRLKPLAPPNRKLSERTSA